MGKSITMHHPQSGVTQRASADAYERVWADEGWQLVDEPEPAAAEPDGDEVPAGTIDEVLVWVGDDRDRAARAHEFEVAKGDGARSTLVTKLAALAAAE